LAQKPAGGLTVAKEARCSSVSGPASLFVSLLAILALRVVSAPAPGISLYRPTADPVALVSIAAFMALVGQRPPTCPHGAPPASIRWALRRD
jgi:hypothetical protein